MLAAAPLLTASAAVVPRPVEADGGAGRPPRGRVPQALPRLRVLQRRRVHHAQVSRACFVLYFLNVPWRPVSNGHLSCFRFHFGTHYSSSAGVLYYLGIFRCYSDVLFTFLVFLH